MLTQILFPDEKGIAAAAECLRNGQPVCMPTETVYGLACDGLNPEAVREVYRVKGRPADNPLILHIAALEELFVLTSPDPALLPLVLRLADAFWPGPLTMVLPRKPVVPDVITAGGDTVAVRMPSHPVAHALIKASGCPIAAPSANLSGRPSPTNLRDCVEDLSSLIPVILDGGDCSVGVESTVIDLTHRPFAILRPGGISREELSRVLGEEVTDVSTPPSSGPVRSPGMKYKHYAPSTPLTALMGSGEESLSYLLKTVNTPAGHCVLCYNGVAERLRDAGFDILPIGEECNPVEQARHIFASLREGDRRKVSHLWVMLSPDLHGSGAAVYNRLLRACAGDMLRLSGEEKTIPEKK